MGRFSLYISLQAASLRHRMRATGRKGRARGAILSCLGLSFWLGTFVLFWRVLQYFQGIEALGDFLAAKLMSMVLAVFFSVLLFSAIITSLSTHFLSEDLQLLFSWPFSLNEIFHAKLMEATINSSWMLLLFGFPIFLAYGVVYGAPVCYYGLCLLVVLPFLIIASSLGAIVIMLLVHVFPARRTRDVLFVLSILFVVVLYLLFRFLQPETLVDPEGFGNLIDYFTSLRAASSPLLPSSWAAESLLPILQGYQGAPVFYLLMLWSTSLALPVVADRIASRVYFQGWSKSQESRRVKFSQGRILDRFLSTVTSPLSPAVKAMVEKDVKVFFRDTTQWTQLLLLGSLVVVYIYNFKVLPLQKAPIATVYLQNVFSFLNLGLAGFVLAAIAVRFVFPAVSMEGQAFWIIRTSPFGLGRFLLGKFFLSLLPLVILAEILIYFTNLCLEVADFMMILSLVTIFFMVFGITSLGVGIGSLYPRFKHENTAEIPSGFGGLIYMIFAMALVGVTVALEAHPTYLLIMSQLRQVPLLPGFYLEAGIALVGIVVVNVVAVVIPFRLGLRNLADMEGIE